MEGPHLTTMSMGRGGVDFCLMSDMHLPASGWGLCSPLTNQVTKNQPATPHQLLLAPIAVDQISWSQKRAWQTAVISPGEEMRRQEGI